MKRTFRGKFIGGGGSNGCEGKKVCLLWAASTAANVTKASFKSSTVPPQTTFLACEPSERNSKETAAILVSLVA